MQALFFDPNVGRNCHQILSEELSYRHRIYEVVVQQLVDHRDCYLDSDRRHYLNDLHSLLDLSIHYKMRFVRISKYFSAT